MSTTGKSKEQIKEEQRQRGFNTYKKNLIPFNEMDIERRRELCQKGQKAMIEQKKKRKTIKEVIQAVAELDADDIADNYADSDLVEKLRGTGEDITLYDLMAVVQMQNAIKGSTRSAEFIRDSAGDKPTDKIQAEIETITDIDRELLSNISDRLDSLEAVDV